jgi:hypothetical protein
LPCLGGDYVFGDKIEQCQRADIEDDILGEIKAVMFCDMTRRKFMHEYEKILEELLKEVRYVVVVVQYIQVL